MTSGRVLLINPTITSRRSARFPLAVMTLAHSLEGEYETTMIDVLTRHYPDVAPALQGVDNAFAPWKRVGG